MTWDELQYTNTDGIALQDADVWDQYQTFSYHVSLLMLGENIDPQTPLEKFCAFCIVMTGLMATALVVANMTYYVKVILQDSEAYHESMDNAEVLMDKLRLPNELQQLVREYMKYRHRKQLMIAPESYTQFLDGLSDELRRQVVVETSRKFILKCWLLGAFIQVPKAAARVLELLEDRVYMPKDIVVSYDDYPDGMYFIDSGILGVYSQNEELLAELGEGSFFGEIALLLNRKRSATVCALTWCNVKMLSKASFDMILQDLPKDVHLKITTKLTGIANARVVHEQYHEEDAVAELNREATSARQQQNEHMVARRPRRTSSVFTLGGSRSNASASVRSKRADSKNDGSSSSLSPAGSSGESGSGSNIFRRGVTVMRSFRKTKEQREESNNTTNQGNKDSTSMAKSEMVGVEMVAAAPSNERITSARMTPSGTKLVGETSPPKPFTKAKNPDTTSSPSNQQPPSNPAASMPASVPDSSASSAATRNKKKASPRIKSNTSPRRVGLNSSAIKRPRRKSESLPNAPATPEGEARFNMFRGAFANRQRADPQKRETSGKRRQLNQEITAKRRPTDYGSKTSKVSKRASKMASM